MRMFIESVDFQWLCLTYPSFSQSSCSLLPMADAQRVSDVLTVLRGSSSSDSESDCEVMPLSKMVRQLSAEWKQLGEQHEAGLSPPTTPLDPGLLPRGGE